MATVKNNSLNAPIPFMPTKGGTGVASPTIHSLPIAQGSSAFNFVTLTDGEVLGGVTGADPKAFSFVAGTNMTVTVDTGAGTITFDASAALLPWTAVTGSTQTIAVNNAYIANKSTLVTFTLPATAAVGDEFIIVGKGSGGWLVAQNSGQAIVMGNVTSLSGTGGSVASSLPTDSFTAVCTATDTEFTIYQSSGDLTVTIS